MIQFKRLKTGTNINTVQLEVGQPLVDPNKSLLYIGTDSDKLKFYDSNHVDTKVVNTVQVGSSEIKPTSGKLKFEAGTNVTLEANTTTKTVTISSSYRNTAHNHSKGEGLSVTGSGGVDGEVSYSLNAATQASLGGIKLGFNAQSGMLPIKLGEGDDDKKAYASLPTASTSSLGGVKSHETGTKPDRDYYVEVKSDSTMKVNVPWSNTAHNHLNGEGLSVSGSGGIDGNVTYSLNAAKTDKLGGIKVKEVLTTEQSVEKVSDNHKYYGIDIDKNGKAFVDVPMYQLPTAATGQKGGVFLRENYGIGCTTGGDFWIHSLCDRDGTYHYQSFYATTNLSDGSSNHSLVAYNKDSRLGSFNYPFGNIYTDDINIADYDHSSMWGASSGGYISLKSKLQTIDTRLTSLGFKSGSIALPNGNASVNQVKRQGNYVIVNLSISYPQTNGGTSSPSGVTGSISSETKSMWTFTIPKNFRPTSTLNFETAFYAAGAGYGSYTGSWTHGNCSISTDGTMTLALASGYYTNILQTWDLRVGYEAPAIT